MTRTKAVLLGILTFWPAVYMLFFMVYMIVMVTTSMSHGSRSVGGGPPLEFIFIFVMHALTMLISFGMVAYYIVHLFQADAVDKDKKVLWAVVLFMGNAIAMPIYWYLYIWKPLNTSTTPAPVDKN